MSTIDTSSYTAGDTTGDAPVSTTVSRRGALALGAAASALLRGGRAAADSIRTGGGIAGGGWATWADGEAQFSVFGSRFTDEDTDEPALFGSFRWVDTAGPTLTSETITSYGTVEPAETTRELVGYVRNADGDTLHPFSLTMMDGGGPGEKLDTLTLLVGPAVDAGSAGAGTPTTGDVAIDAGTAVVSVEAVVEVGDLQLLTFDFGG